VSARGGTLNREPKKREVRAVPLCGQRREYVTGIIAVATFLRAFLWGREAPPQKRPGPNCRGYGYSLTDNDKFAMIFRALVVCQEIFRGL